VSRRSWDDWPPPSKPRRVEGGIKAHTKRGEFAQRWWAKRWIAALERFELGTRLTRGRAYARAGQVTEIAIEPGGVRARVQGSRAQPYAVSIRVRTLTDAEWTSVGAAISANTRLAAMLLAGEMPEDIETAFAAAGTTLFPATQRELETSCSCPDWSNPCKHVAAVFYLIGEEFDRDPFLLFALRGLARDALRDLLASPRVAEIDELVEIEEPPEAVAPESVAGSFAGFWGAPLDAGAHLKPTTRAPEAPAVDAILLRKAGHFPFWRGDESLEDALVPIYARATETALTWLSEHPES
jgi:uncharacterized Zn finger protein